MKPKQKNLLLLLLILIIIPLIIVQIIPTDSPEPYVYKARITENLGSTLNGTLQYYRANRIEGTTPETEFAILFSTSYTRGLKNTKITIGEEYWMQGSSMTKEVFYGEHYIFHDTNQLYIRQIKKHGLWPDQTTGLKIFYTTPLTSLATPFFLPFYPFQEEYRFSTFIILLLKSLLILIAIMMLRKNKELEKRLQLIMVYSIITIILTIPILTDLY